ncbi:unnamed protein product [Schistosoma spindalis]|nr:unnamed protein product [Schistosoma spindale]
MFLLFFSCYPSYSLILHSSLFHNSIDLNCKPTRPPPYEIALALKYPQNANSQRAYQSLKNDMINTRHENNNNSINNNNNNYHIASNLSSGIKHGTGKFCNHKLLLFSSFCVSR